RSASPANSRSSLPRIGTDVKESEFGKIQMQRFPNNPEPPSPCAPVRIVPVLALMLLAGCSQQPSHIRVQNLTGLDFSNVTVMTNTFGSVKAGALTEYLSVPAVFEEAPVYTSQADGHFINHRFI